MFDIGSGELLLILIAVLVFFGPKKIPELAKSLGKGIREFKRAQQQFTDQINTAFTEEDRRKAYSAEPRHLAPEQSFSLMPQGVMQPQLPADTEMPVHDVNQQSLFETPPANGTGAHHDNLNEGRAASNPSA